MEGANPEVMEEDVTDVLEEQLNTIAGVRSCARRRGRAPRTISVEFELDQDIDVAAQDVRDQLARARMRLPQEVETARRRQDQPLEHADHVDPDERRPRAGRA